MFRRYRSRKITLDPAATAWDSPAVRKRLDRIETHYDALERLFDDLEQRMELDDRLAEAIEETDPSPDDAARPRQPR